MIEYGSEFDWDSNIPFLRNECGGLPLDARYNVRYYRSGRDALKAVALKYKHKYKHVLLPSLCCVSMASPFIVNGYTPSFYKINRGLSADTEDVGKKLQSDSLLVFNNYFGSEPLTRCDIKTIKEKHKNIIIIEDRTHDMIVPRREEHGADYVAASIRKWLAVPDGGILYSEKATEGFKEILEEDREFSRIRKEALILKSEYLKNGGEKLKSEYRTGFGSAERLLDEDGIPRVMSNDSMEIISHTDFNAVYETRIKNIFTLNKCFYGSGINTATAYPEKSCLYYPVLVDNRDRIQTELAARRIYCPVIWSIPGIASNTCDVSEYISAHILALPCDQRYDEKDMEYIASQVVSGVTGVCDLHSNKNIKAF